ncbi:MAG: hypothetical protein P8K10_05605 [Crocinitomicaceae bacterium]|jgi:hypothetical protein|nr:hypothetical protein [Crocinitomicaceae bacterium]
MKIGLLTLFVLCEFVINAQGAFKKSSKDNDYLVVVNDGIQFNIGASYLMPSKELSGDLSSGTGRGEYAVLPEGKLGYFAELGFAHFPKWKGIPIKFLKKSRIIDYFDWGLGYKVLAGKESTSIDRFNSSNELISTSNGIGEFQNSSFFSRVSAHSLIYYGKKKIDKARKHFIDNAFGFNFDYTQSQGNQVYNDGFTDYALEHKFQGQFNLQFHYSLGVGIRFNRAWMMIPAVEMPLIGIHQWNGFNAKMNWFSSQYWPILIRVKFIKLFERVPKCGAYGDPSDMKFDKKFRSGNF